MSSLPTGWIPAFSVAALCLLLALLESALPLLCHGRRKPIPDNRLGLRARMAADPVRTRRAAVAWRLLLVTALLVIALLATPGARVPVAAIALLSLATVYTLERSGSLRRLGVRLPWIADVIALLLAPSFSLPFWNGRAARGAAVEDLADVLATEPVERQRMVQALLELEQRAVEEIMVPRSEVVALDLDGDWDGILELLRNTPHTRLPVCEGDLDRVVGLAHMKRVANELAGGRLDRKRLREIALQRPPLFVPEGSTLQSQLIRFRRLRRRIAFVVDEYGGMQGILTLEDILEEVVGEFTTQPTLLHREWHAQPDGSYLVSGGATLRAINRSLGWDLPTDGPRTMSGLIVEYLESIPDPGTSLKLGPYAIEVLQVSGNAVRTARVWPVARKPAA